MVILDEEVKMSIVTILDILKQIVDPVQAKATQDKYRVTLISKRLVESILQFYALLQENHGLRRQAITPENIPSNLSPWASTLLISFLSFIKKEILLSLASDESAQLSQIENEAIVIYIYIWELKLVI